MALAMWGSGMAQVIGDSAHNSALRLAKRLLSVRGFHSGEPDARFTVDSDACPVGFPLVLVEYQLANGIESFAQEQGSQGCRSADVVAALDPSRSGHLREQTHEI